MQVLRFLGLTKCLAPGGVEDQDVFIVALYKLLYVTLKLCQMQLKLYLNQVQLGKRMFIFCRD